MLTCPCWSIYVLYTLKMALTTACNNMYPRYGQPVRMVIYDNDLQINAFIDDIFRNFFFINYFIELYRMTL